MNALADIKLGLPDGVTALVDQRSHFGGLKYPDKDLYRMFLLMENISSSLATPHNLTAFGSSLLSSICHGMLEKEKNIEL